MPRVIIIVTTRARYRKSDPNHEELESRVTFTLETVENCTKLTLVNDQWTENHPSYKNAEGHWWMILSNIKTVAETGRTLDFGW